MKISISMALSKKQAELRIHGIGKPIAKHVAKALLFPTHRDANTWIKDVTEWMFEAYGLAVSCTVPFKKEKFLKRVFEEFFIPAGKYRGLEDHLDYARFAIEDQKPSTVSSGVDKKLEAMFRKAVDRLYAGAGRHEVRDIFYAVKTFSESE